MGLVIGVVLYAQDVPKDRKTEFTSEVLKQRITSQDGTKQQIGDVLRRHAGKVVIVDFWASWCRDCLNALPQTEILKKNNPNVDFVYFSLDRSDEQWRRGLEKYQLTDNENYWFDEGWRNAFNNYIDLNWIPRFLVIDQTGRIAKYYAISPQDPDIQKAIDRLSE